MLTNENAYQRLVTEIRGAFKSHKDISWNGAKDLPYLEACINEALRMFPPVPGNLNRVVPSEGALIDGKWVAGEVSNICYFTELGLRTCEIPIPNSDNCIGLFVGRVTFTSELHRSPHLRA